MVHLITFILHFLVMDAMIDSSMNGGEGAERMSIVHTYDGSSGCISRATPEDYSYRGTGGAKKFRFQLRQQPPAQGRILIEWKYFPLCRLSTKKF